VGDVAQEVELLGHDSEAASLAEPHARAADQVARGQQILHALADVRQPARLGDATLHEGRVVKADAGLLRRLLEQHLLEPRLQVLQTLLHELLDEVPRQQSLLVHHGVGIVALTRAAGLRVGARRVNKQATGATTWVGSHQRVELAQHENQQVELVVLRRQVDEDELAKQLLANPLVSPVCRRVQYLQQHSRLLSQGCAGGGIPGRHAPV